MAEKRRQKTVFICGLIASIATILTGLIPMVVPSFRGWKSWFIAVGLLVVMWGIVASMGSELLQEVDTDA